jgi:hypothetical protein
MSQMPVPAESAPRRGRFAAPGWRILGAGGGWLLFAFSFVLIYQAASILSGIGGYCASGGPYVIATSCPDVVLWAFPVGFIGVFLSWGVALVFQRGFAAPVLVWGWPILFIGLGIEFFLSIPTSGLVVAIVCGGLFVIMGLAPLIFELRAGPRRVVLGRADIHDVLFAHADGKKLPRTFYAFSRDKNAPTTEPAPGDWLLSLAVTLVAITGGVLLGLLAATPHVLGIGVTS